MHYDEGVYLPVYSEYTEGSRSSHMLMCVCVGKCLLTSCERIIQKKTLNPFVLTQSGWMLYYNKNTVKEHFVQQVKIRIKLTKLLD